jgi:hypothetical protein
VRDPYLPRFEQWIDAKLHGLPEEVRKPVLHFATWHHLRRIRAKAVAGSSTRGPVHSAKQEITETVKFLVWLHKTYKRTASTCTQQDVDEWLATGPTTRTAIRTFFVVAKTARLNTEVAIQPRLAKASPSLSQDQRLAWIHELLTGASESLGDRWRHEECDRNCQEERRNVRAMVGVSASGEETEDVECQQYGKEHVPEA